MVALFVVCSLLLFLTIDHLVQRMAIRAQAREPVRVRVRAPMPAPDLFVGPGHAWARLEPAGTLRVGADGLAGMLLGRFDRIDVAAPGTALRRGDPLATLAAGDRRVVLRAPFDATVASRNEALAGDPTQVAADPFGHWLARLTPKAAGHALRGMKIGDEATSWFRAELSRLRDALVGAAAGRAGTTMADGGLPASAATMLDGGAPAPGAAAALPPETFARIADELFSVPADSVETR